MMRAQEEEMRQNMEELQATQEELTRRSRDLDIFVGAINKSTLLIEIDRNGLIAKANDKFLTAMQYSMSELSGLPYSSHMSEESIEHNQEIKLWDQLKSNLGVEVEEKRVKKDGSPLWLHSTYIPVINEENSRLEKIVCISTDATREMVAKLRFEKLQEEERERKEESIKHQRVMMDKLLAKSKDKEKKFKERIYELEKETQRLLVLIGGAGTQSSGGQTTKDNPPPPQDIME
jgi:PAS domain S-box-containing protein